MIIHKIFNFNQFNLIILSIKVYLNYLIIILILEFLLLICYFLFLYCSIIIHT